MRQGSIYLFNKHVLGIDTKEGVLPFDLCCEALEVAGRSKPIDVTAKQWVEMNSQFIEQIVDPMFPAKRPSMAERKRNKQLEKHAQKNPTKFKLPRVAPLIHPKKPKQNRINGKHMSGGLSSHDLYVASPEFLSSYEWRTLRMQVLKHYGAKCLCCGASPATGAVIHIDHIKPRKTHPHLALVFDNLQPLCEACNHGKSNWDETDWRPKEIK